jgi:OOP family OmpA-OmpF porin
MKLISISMFALAAALSAGGASAQSSSAYVTLSAGPSKMNVDCAGTTACSTSSTAGKGLFGYKVTPVVAIEASYAYLGKITATVPVGGTPVDASIKGEAIGLGVAGLFPLGTDWTGIARLGVASTKATVSVSGGGVSGSDSKTTTQAFFGLGIDYVVSPGFAIGAAWDRTRLGYADSTATVDSLNVTATFKF